MPASVLEGNMKTFSFGALVLTAGITGLLSFGFLAAAIGSEYWYIIKVNQTDVGDFDSHSGLWRIHEGKYFFAFRSEHTISLNPLVS